MNTSPKIALIAALLSAYAIGTQAQSQDFFDQPIVEINIEIPEPGWHDTLIVRKKRDDKTPVSGTVTIAGKSYSNVEMRYKGNSSFHGTVKHGGNKMPMKLEPAKGTHFDGGYDELRLSNNFRDPSAIREILAYQIASTYIPTPHVTNAVVTVNGEYLGIYTMTEGMSERMLNEFFCNSDGALVKCDPEFNKSPEPGCPKGEFSNLAYLGDRSDCYQHLYHIKGNREARSIVNLAKFLDQNRDPEEYLNVFETLWMHALNNVLVNLDSYLGIFTHNYYVYKDQNDIYHPLIWDLNLAFGGFATLDQQVYPEMETLSPIVHDKYLKGRRPLIQALTSEKTLEYTYFYMINTIVNDWFANGRFMEVAKEMQARIGPYIEKEREPIYTMDDFYTNLIGKVKKGDNRSIPGIGDLMTARTEYLQQHPLLQRKVPQLLEWNSEIFDGGVAVSMSSDIALEEAFIYYQAVECGPWKKKAMVPLNGVAFEADVEGLHACYFLLSTGKGVSLAPSAAPGEVFKMEAR